MKDLVIKNGEIYLTSDPIEKLKFKIERILTKIPPNYSSYDFSYLEYKAFILKELDKLAKDYPGINFDTLKLDEKEDYLKLSPEKRAEMISLAISEV